jgi:2-phosphosulfolactate phosphatase
VTTGANPAPAHLRQDGNAYRFEWGPNGLRTLAPLADVVVIVDVLRFTTAVSVAVERGAVVLPYRWEDEGAAAYADAHEAVLLGTAGEGPSLSPADLLALTPGTRLVLPSPNGSAMAFAARDHGARHVLAGCLRNATATARRARLLAGRSGVIVVIAAGERWRGTTGPLRPAVEDLIGAGAVFAALDPSASVGQPACSPEAAAARSAFLGARSLLHETLAASASGQELLAQGAADELSSAAALDVTTSAAELVGDAFVGR